MTNGGGLASKLHTRSFARLSARRNWPGLTLGYRQSDPGCLLKRVVGRPSIKILRHLDLQGQSNLVKAVLVLGRCEKKNADVIILLWGRQNVAILALPYIYKYMYSNDCRIAKLAYRYTTLAQNSPKLVRNGQNWSKWPKLSQNVKSGPKLVRNGQNWLKMAEIGPK